MSNARIGTILGLTVALALPTAAGAGATCPDVESAKAALTRTTSPQGVPGRAPRVLASSPRQEIQAPREQNVQSPRGPQDIQAPRGQDLQAPRDQQGIQAPRSEDQIQAPRGSQDIQAPRSQDVQAPRNATSAATTSQNPRTSADLGRAATLVEEAERACQAGHTSEASLKAQAAMNLMKK
jgi:hypothetical protein